MTTAARTQPPGPSDLTALLQDMATRVSHVRQAVVLSADGLALGSSHGLTREDAEHLAALAAGIQSLARRAGHRFEGGRVRQTIIEMDDALLFIATAGHGACLAVLTDRDPDTGLVAYEMARLVRQVGHQLMAMPRRPSQ